ncbi:MAG: hypothetical protein COV44_03395 [Deltaproteobacteria bacterium CG11_big_fil_rev_8_21_14_0_20_45_16]|nr:MAG: hypothetical protein COV44_03395 [Deltaproteobacteria bacterium CG11_big_fil_rev_8_21_14_0_20_45_16]
MILHQSRLRLALSLISLSFVLVACGGNSHGPTSFTSNDDLLSRRKNSVTDFVNQTESAERAADEKNIQDFKSAQKEQKNEISARSLNTSSFSADSVGSGGSNFSSADPLSGQNWAMMGLAMAPALMTGVFGLGKNLLNGQDNEAEADSHDKPAQTPRSSPGTSSQSPFSVEQIMEPKPDNEPPLESPTATTNLRSGEPETEKPATITIKMPKIAASESSSLGLNDSPSSAHNCAVASGPFSVQQNAVQKILTYHGEN